MKYHIPLLLIVPVLLFGTNPVIFGDRSFRVQIATPGMMRDAMKTEFQRYDTCGAVTRLEIEGRNLIVFPGLSDEFNIENPPGYDDRNGKPGDLFLKIGILLREDSRSYSFYRAYPVVKYAETTFRRKGDSVFFHQILPDFNGWSYEYTKEYRINSSRREIRISYTLKNTGRKVLNASQYNHNYFHYGKEFPDSGYIIRSGFVPVAERKFEGFMQTGNLAGDFQKSAYMFSLKRVPPEQHRVILSHIKNSIKTIISGDFAITRYAVSFGKGKYISPEMYLHFSLAPRETKQWTRIYQFAGDIKNNKG